MTDQERLDEARQCLRIAAAQVASAQRLLEALPSHRGAYVLGALGHVTPWLLTARREAYYASLRKSPRPR